MEFLRTGPAALLVAAMGATAGEHPACQDVDFSYRGSTPDELREIAQSCAVPEMAELYHHRARRAELIADHAVMSRLEQVQRSLSDRWTMQEDALFITLVELLSTAYGLSSVERTKVINTAFDHTNEVAELRLRGYDLQADRLRDAGISPR